MRTIRSLLGLLATTGITTVLGGTLVVFFWLPRRVRLFDRFATLWSQVILGSFGVKATVSGRDEEVMQQPAVFMVNHQSLLDTPLLFLHVTPRLRMVAKKSLRLVPFMGWGMAVNDFVFVDRQDRSSAIASLDRAGRKIAAGTPVLVFPEGTRSFGDRLLPFKKGGFMLAIKAQVPIIPLKITGSARLLPRNRLLARSGQVHIAIGRPIPTRGMSPEQRDELMEQVRQAIEALPVAPPAVDRLAAPRAGLANPAVGEAGTL